MDSDEENLPENDVEANIQTPKTPIETIEVSKSLILY